MPPFITEVVLVAIVTGFFGFLSTVMNSVTNRQSEKIKGQFKNIEEKIDGLTEVVAVVQQNTERIERTSLENRDGIRYTQRYRLFHDMQKDIHSGHTTLLKRNEITKLYDSYHRLGGNSEISDLYEVYRGLELSKEMVQDEVIE